MSSLLLADAQDARRAAEAILRESRFHNPSVPRPLHSALHSLGTGLQAIGNAISSAVEAVGSLLPGGAVTAWVLLAVLVIAIVALVARRYTRAALTRPANPDARGARRPVTAAQLERAAQEAESAGAFADAVRLRFRAGLERLGEQGAISHPRSTPSAQVARELDSRGFDALARRFDEIAYGEQPAAADDVQAARAGWSELLSGARGR